MSNPTKSSARSKNNEKGFVYREPEQATSDSAEQFTLFWHAKSPFSQHHLSEFIIDGVKYNCAEQYMMHQKALTFNDAETANLIMAALNPDEQKKLGRQVQGFNDDVWNKYDRDIVKKASTAKNKSLRSILLGTVGTTLVEASPVDRKWGIGLDEKDPRARQRQKWRGRNLLGEILTEVRDELIASDTGKDRDVVKASDVQHGANSSERHVT